MSVAQRSGAERNDPSAASVALLTARWPGGYFNCDVDGQLARRPRCSESSLRFVPSSRSEPPRCYEPSVSDWHSVSKSVDSRSSITYLSGAIWPFWPWRKVCSFEVKVVSFVDFDVVHQQLHAADTSTVLSCNVRDNDTS